MGTLIARETGETVELLSRHRVGRHASSNLRLDEGDGLGWGGEALALSGCSFLETTLATISTAPGEEAGDGLVATNGAPPALVEQQLLVLDDNDFQGNARAHILVEGVTVEVGSNSLWTKGTEWLFVTQGGPVVSGIGGGPPGVEPTELAPADALELYRLAFPLDEL